MIDFHYETNFHFENEDTLADWVNRIVTSEFGVAGQLDYIFCDDEYLLDMNRKFLGHDTYTDIITFDYSEAGFLSGDIFISVDRVRDNAKQYTVPFRDEILRVMAHGVLHLLGYKDKSKEDASLMRDKENEKMRLFHVEH